MDFFGNRPTGARVCFRTNAEEFTLKMVFKTLKFDIALGLYCCQSAEIFVGKDRKSSKFLSLFGPLDYDTKIVEKTKPPISARAKELCIFFPVKLNVKGIKASIVVKEVTSIVRNFFAHAVSNPKKFFSLLALQLSYSKIALLTTVPKRITRASKLLQLRLALVIKRKKKAPPKAGIQLSKIKKGK